MLLDELAEPLQRAGLDRINISLDTLREDTFQKISRRPGLDRVLAGIEAAQRVGFRKIRLNAIAIRGPDRGRDYSTGAIRQRARFGIAIHRIHAARRRRGVERTKQSSPALRFALDSRNISDRSFQPSATMQVSRPWTTHSPTGAVESA